MTTLTERLRELETLDAERTPGEWIAGVHPGNHRINIIKPITFGKYVGKLPECEGGHVYFLHAGTAKFIAAAPSAVTLAQELHALLVECRGTLSIPPTNPLRRASHELQC